MPIVKKVGKYNDAPAEPQLISSEEAILALAIYKLEKLIYSSLVYNVQTTEQELKQKYRERYGHDDWKKVAELIMSKIQPREPDNRVSILSSYSAIYRVYAEKMKRESEQIQVEYKQKTVEPRKENHGTWGIVWYYKGNIYKIDDIYSDEQSKLLILDEDDKERRRFENLNLKFNNPSSEGTINSRPRIPENVRIEVWRRDGGKCARCGSRDKLEYDHIVPISKGGSNTARNIELLCEKCNRSKHDNVA
jgi:hypothetical protein